MDELMKMHDVDIQWGNHDISWMGAASGNLALIANVIRISMRYNNFDVLEDGYGLNLRALAVFAGETYKNDECAIFMPQTLDDNIYDPVDAKLVAKMHKAITVIQLKLEGQLIRRHPEWKLSHRDLFSMVDFANGTITIDGQIHKLLDGNFPTVDPADPLALTEGENELMTILANSFMHSDRLNTHMRFLYSKGSMYKTINGNLLFHGCIPLDENGKLLSLSIAGEQYSGKAMLDKLDEIANKAYFLQPCEEKSNCADHLWYLWSGARSPLYGKDKMAFFERYFLEDKKLHKENYNAYYHFSEKPEICGKILEMFGLDPQRGHIINGHVPVKIKMAKALSRQTAGCSLLTVVSQRLIKKPPVSQATLLFMIPTALILLSISRLLQERVSILLRYIWWKDLTVGQTFQIPTREGNCFCR